MDKEPAGLELLKARVTGGKRWADPHRMRFVRRGRRSACAPHPCRLLPAILRSGQFLDLWARIRQALLPGGIFAGQLFGIHDSWVGDPGMVFHDLREVKNLLDGLETLELHETERDGEAFSDPKHWHLYDILAREPADRAIPAGTAASHAKTTSTAPAAGDSAVSGGASLATQLLN